MLAEVPTEVGGEQDESPWYLRVTQAIARKMQRPKIIYVMDPLENDGREVGFPTKFAEQVAKMHGKQ